MIHLRSVKPIAVNCDATDVWTKWKESVLRPIVDWRSELFELVLKLDIQSGATVRTVRCLFDSGARIPLTIRHGVFPDDKLKPARFPVQFCTVNGTPMQGGERGLFASLRLPICVKGDKFVFVKTMALFAYVADIHDVDVIVGYPFLKAFNLLIDCAQDRLRVGLNPVSGTKSPNIVESIDNKGQKICKPKDIIEPLKADSTPTAVKELIREVLLFHHMMCNL